MQKIILATSASLVKNSSEFRKQFFSSMFHIHGYYTKRTSTESNPLWHLLPNTQTVVALLFSAFFTCLSSVIFCCDGAFNTVTHVVVGAVALTVTILLIFSSDQILSHFAERFIGHSKRD
jgi:hypothetical protein